MHLKFFFISCDSPSLKTKETVAFIGSETINIKLLISELNQNIKHSQNLTAKMFEDIKLKSLNQIIYRNLVLKYSSKYSLSIQHEEITHAYEQYIGQLDTQSLNNFLKEEKLNLKQWKKKLRFSLLEKKVIQHIEKKYALINDSEIIQYYQEHKNSFIKKKLYKLKTFNFSDKKKATKALEALRNGYSVNYLQKNYNLESKNIVSFELNQLKETPWHSLDNRSKGAVTDLINSNNQYQIAQLTAITNKKALKFDEVKNKIKNTLISNKNLNYGKILEENIKYKVRINSSILKGINLKNWRLK